LCINFDELARYIKLPKRAEQRLRKTFNCSFKKYTKNPLKREIEKLINTGNFGSNKEIADHLGLSDSYVSRTLKRGE